MSIMLQTLQHHAKFFPQQLALEDSQQQLTYPQLQLAVAQLAQWLQQQEIRCLALHGGNSADWVIVDLACQQADIICLPLPLFFSPQQIRSSLQQAAADLLLSEVLWLPGQCELDSDSPLESVAAWPMPARYHVWRLHPEAAAALPDGTRKVTFTSGSTGTPKGVCLNNELPWQVAQSLADVIAIKQPRHLCLLPLSTLLENIAGVYSPLLCGGTIIIRSDSERGMHGSSKLDSQALLLCISQVAPQSLILVPQLLRLLVGAAQQGWQVPASLQFVAVGGGLVDPYLLAQAWQCGIPVYEGYGLSECASVVALSTAADHRPGAVGKILPHCQVSIEDDEVVVSGACHLGYAGIPDSWYPRQIKTGDLGKCDDGWLHIQGRRKHLLITSFGRNISPEWVEAALLASPLLHHCQVFGDGEAFLSALISANPEISEQQIAHWIEQANQQLPDYARVRRWLRLDDQQLLPYMTANGRVQRQRLADAFSAELAQLYSDDAQVI